MNNIEKDTIGSKVAIRSKKIGAIKESLKDFALISKNKKMVLRKLNHYWDSHSQSDSTDGLSIETQDHSMRSDFEHAQLFAEKYDSVAKIGQGSDGVVYRCIKKKTGKQLAAKSFMFQDQHVPQLRHNFMLVKSLNHRNIVKYQALYLDLKKHSSWLVMELCESPSLFRTPIHSENQLRNLTQQLLETLYYLHQRSVTHRDVKPENILYDPSTQKMKLIDFGICHKHKQRNIRKDMLTITGTLYYRAPEMFSGGGYNEKVDIWATGITIYKIVTGRTPFQSEYHSQTLNNIEKAQVTFPEEFDEYSPSLKTLVSKMLIKDPKERPSALECLRELWFSHNSTCPYPCQVHFCQDQNQEDLEGMKSPMIQAMDESMFVRKINGDEYHCFDSEDEGHHHVVGMKRHCKSLAIDFVQLTL